jgi:hypothetical protein
LSKTEFLAERSGREVRTKNGFFTASGIEEKTRFEAVAGGLLRELGYENEES